MFSSTENKNNLIGLLPVDRKTCFKWHKLLFETEEPFVFNHAKLELENELIFDLWENNFDIENKIHFNDDWDIHYDHNQNCVPFILKFENINGVIQCGESLNRIHYFKPTVLIQSSLIYEIFADFERKICDHDLLDSGGLIRLNCSQKLPQNRVSYFRNLHVCFDKVEKFVHRGNNKYYLDARII